jgi:hypothetical protein
VVSCDDEEEWNREEESEDGMKKTGERTPETGKEK